MENQKKEFMIDRERQDGTKYVLKFVEGKLADVAYFPPAKGEQLVEQNGFRQAYYI